MEDELNKTLVAETDHGTASNVFLLSGGLKKQGFYNNEPDLTNLDDGDLKYEVDFRQIYATILDRWMNADSNVVLNQSFDHLNFI